MKKSLYILCILLTITTAANAKYDSVRVKIFSDKLEAVCDSFHGRIGYAILNVNKSDIFVAGGVQFPMQSTYKFPLALCVLHGGKKGSVYLTKTIHINKSDLRKTWSPLRDKYPEGNIDLTVAELLEYSISQSDNNACDILFKLVKGPKTVNKYIRSTLGKKNISIVATEAKMATSWNVQYKNWTTPGTMAYLLTDFYNDLYLPHEETQLLLKWMTESSNSDKRIKGLLPLGTAVAHKTGTSDTNKEGITAAVNDIGIVTLPNGTSFAIAVFIMNTTETKEKAEHAIAEIAKAAYDYYSGL